MMLALNEKSNKNIAIIKLVSNSHLANFFPSTPLEKPGVLNILLSTKTYFIFNVRSITGPKKNNPNYTKVLFSS